MRLTDLLPLDQAVQLLLRGRGITYIRLVRRGAMGVDLSIRIHERYRILKVEAQGVSSAAERDAQLYDKLTDLLGSAVC